MAAVFRAARSCHFFAKQSWGSWPPLTLLLAQPRDPRRHLLIIPAA